MAIHKHYSITQADEAILTSFSQYHYLTVDQVKRLHYSRGSATYVSEKLRILAEYQFVHRQRLSATHPYVYSLGNRGVRFLQSQGIDIHVHPSEHEHLSHPFMSHTLAVNEFLMAASFLSQVNASFALFAMKHDLTLKRMMAGIVPDGWMDFRRGRQQQCIWLELDRGTMEQKRFRKKVAELLAFAGDGYEEIFATPSITVAIATTAGATRLNALIDWTRQELKEQHKVQEADLFRFVALPTGSLDSTWLFLTPAWYVPFQQSYVPLLDQ